MPIIDPNVALSSRQEAFCRHYAVSGNAADAARRAGYSARSARQTGCALLERPWIVERLRRIRASWKRTERNEARILLARLEQAWDAAVASGSACLMLQTLRLQAEIAGLTVPRNRARLWTMPEEDEFREVEAGETLDAEPGPLADAVRQGHARAEQALARHRESREALERREGFDEAAHEETDRRLAAAVEERTRLPVRFEAPRPPENDRPLADDPDSYCEDACSADEPAPDDDRADGAEHDWLYQRRNGFAPIHDPWAPDNIERRRRDSLEWLQRCRSNDPLDDHQPCGTDRPDNGEFTPGHDIA